jgi:hypothetical protein
VIEIVADYNWKPIGAAWKKLGLSWQDTDPIFDTWEGV